MKNWIILNILFSNDVDNDYFLYSLIFEWVMDIEICVVYDTYINYDIDQKKGQKVPRLCIALWSINPFRSWGAAKPK